MAHVILVPIDGSECALNALRFAIAMKRRDANAEIHLVNIQPSLGGAVSTFVGAASVKEFHRDEAAKALASARALLDQEKIAHDVHIGVGPAGETISGFARQLGAEHIVMGSRGMGGAARVIMGSVASDVVQLAPCPVTLVK